MDGFSIGNRSIANQAQAEARSHLEIEPQEQVVRGKVLAVDSGYGYQVGRLDENNFVLEIFDGIAAPADLLFAVDDLVSLKIDTASGVPEILSGSGGGGGNCMDSFYNHGILF